MTRFLVKEPEMVSGNAVRVVLQVDPRDAKRIRVWRVPSGKGKGPRDAVEIIGPKAGHRFVMEDLTKAKPKAGWKHQLLVEALELSDDTFAAPAPSGLAPPPPGSLSKPTPDAIGGSETEPKPNVTDASKSTYPDDIRHEAAAANKSARPSADVWIQLVHEDEKGAEVTALRDVGLFSIAPWIIPPATTTCRRVYAVYLAELERPAAFNLLLAQENHGTVWDLKVALSAAGLCPPPDEDTTARIPVSFEKDVRGPDDAPFFVIDGALCDADRWCQDQMEIGYCWAPDHWLYVAVHAMRLTNVSAGLGPWLVKRLAHAGLGIYNRFGNYNQVSAEHLEVNGFPYDAVNYGGNIEASLPVTEPTEAIGGDAAGPPVPQHPPAPYGKILLGDARDRQVDKEFRDFFFAQKVQPVLPLDTSWLEVGHVDEFMSTVRARGGKHGAKMLVASPKLMSRIFSAWPRPIAKRRCMPASTL